MTYLPEQLAYVVIGDGVLFFLDNLAVGEELRFPLTFVAQYPKDEATLSFVVASDFLDEEPANNSVEHTVQIIDVPRLRIENVEGKFFALWPNWATDYILQSTLDLAKPEWTDVPRSREEIGDDFGVAIEYSEEQLFLRLLLLPQPPSSP